MAPSSGVALTSDVWAFKGGDHAVSNYWRLTYVFWMILNFRCFGLGVFGWHLANILLHVAVVALLFALLRRPRVSRPVAGAIAPIFAVHPAHTESVAWISGAPDLLLAAALLGSTWFVVLLGKKRTPLRWAGALVLYAVALGAKEVAILFPLVVLALLRNKREENETEVSWSQALSIAWPFGAAAVVYLITRASILGATQQLPEGSASLGDAILTAPAVFAFYLRQMIAPYSIGPSYPLRAVTLDNIGLVNFVIPLAVTVVAAWWMIRMAERSKIARRTGPAPGSSFAGDVHRGVPSRTTGPRSLSLSAAPRVSVALTVPVLGALFQRFAGERLARGGALIFVFALIVAIPLGAQTIRYNRAWTSNLALWDWGVRSDPNSSFNYQQYGVQLQEAKRLEEAIAAFDRSIAIHPAPATTVARATALIDQKRFSEAERDLRQVTSKKVEDVNAYSLYQAYERLAIALTQQNKLSDAATAIAEARRRLPQYTAALTEKLAVILYQGGQKNEALNELIGVRASARTEMLPEARLIFYRLGLLHAELGHSQEARDAFQEFLSLTRGMLTPEIEQARSQAETALRNPGR